MLLVVGDSAEDTSFVELIQFSMCLGSVSQVKCMSGNAYLEPMSTGTRENRWCENFIKIDVLQSFFSELWVVGRGGLTTCLLGRFGHNPTAL
jgi:hypothetical protein